MYRQYGDYNESDRLMPTTSQHNVEGRGRYSYEYRPNYPPGPSFESSQGYPGDSWRAHEIRSSFERNRELCGYMPSDSWFHNDYRQDFIRNDSSFDRFYPEDRIRFNNGHGICRTPPREHDFRGRTPPREHGFRGRTPPREQSFRGRTPPRELSFRGRTPPRESGFRSRTPPREPGFHGRSPSREPGFHGRSPSREPGFHGPYRHYSYNPTFAFSNDFDGWRSRDPYSPLRSRDSPVDETSFHRVSFRSIRRKRDSCSLSSNKKKKNEYVSTSCSKGSENDVSNKKVDSKPKSPSILNKQNLPACSNGNSSASSTKAIESKPISTTLPEKSKGHVDVVKSKEKTSEVQDADVASNTLSIQDEICPDIQNNCISDKDAVQGDTNNTVNATSVVLLKEEICKPEKKSCEVQTDSECTMWNNKPNVTYDSQQKLVNPDKAVEPSVKSSTTECAQDEKAKPNATPSPRIIKGKTRIVKNAKFEDVHLYHLKGAGKMKPKTNIHPPYPIRMPHINPAHIRPPYPGPPNRPVYVAPTRLVAEASSCRENNLDDFVETLSDMGDDWREVVQLLDEDKPAIQSSHSNYNRLNPHVGIPSNEPHSYSNSMYKYNRPSDYAVFEQGNSYPNSMMPDRRSWDSPKPSLSSMGKNWTYNGVPRRF